MDLFLVAFLTVVSLWGCLVIGLSVVGFGRVQVVAAAVYFIGFVALIATMALFSPARDIDDVSLMLAQWRRVSTVLEIAFNVSMVALLVFSVSGTARVWNHRRLLFSRIHQFTSPSRRFSSGSSGTEPSQPQNLLKYLLMLPLVCWAIYDFCYNDRGFAYYVTQPHMLFYVLGTTLVITAFLAAIAAYAKRNSTPSSGLHPKPSDSRRV